MVGIGAAKQGQNFPAVQAVQRCVEKDGIDAFAGGGKGLFDGGGFNYPAPLTGEPFYNQRASEAVGVCEKNRSLSQDTGQGLA